MPSYPTTGPGPPPRRGSSVGLVALVVALSVVHVLGLGVAGYFGMNALTGRDESNEPVAEAASGEVFSPPGKPYTVEIPSGMVKVPQREDRAVPSETDLSLELEGKVQFGGLIKTGTLAGPAANGAFDVIGEEAAKGYASEYEANPDQWGTGASVEKRTTKLGGRDAVEIAAKFSPSGDAEPSVFFRVYFIDPPSGPTILITCDWNAQDTADIEEACEALVSSFKIKG